MSLPACQPASFSPHTHTNTHTPEIGRGGHADKDGWIVSGTYTEQRIGHAFSPWRRKLLIAGWRLGSVEESEHRLNQYFFSSSVADICVGKQHRLSLGYVGGWWRWSKSRRCTHIFAIPCCSPLTAYAFAVTAAARVLGTEPLTRLQPTLVTARCALAPGFAAVVCRQCLIFQHAASSVLQR